MTLMPCRTCLKRLPPNRLRTDVRAYNGGHQCFSCYAAARKKTLAKAAERRVARLSAPKGPSLPDGWEEALLDALSEVLYENGLTMSRVMGKAWTNQLLRDERRVPTIKKLAPALTAHGVKLSAVLARAEAKWGL